MLANPKAPCPMFYAFDASYPDGGCHDGHIDDMDDNFCTVERSYIPCPNCRNDEYQSYLVERNSDHATGEVYFAFGEMIMPCGFGNVVFGDYFAPRERDAFDAFYNERDPEQVAP